MLLSILSWVKLMHLYVCVLQGCDRACFCSVRVISLEIANCGTVRMFIWARQAENKKCVQTVCRFTASSSFPLPSFSSPSHFRCHRSRSSPSISLYLYHPLLSHQPAVVLLQYTQESFMQLHINILCPFSEHVQTISAFFQTAQPDQSYDIVMAGYAGVVNRTQKQMRREELQAEQKASLYFGWKQQKPWKLWQTMTGYEKTVNTVINYDWLWKLWLE